jgi:hypothetical protein
MTLVRSQKAFGLFNPSGKVETVRMIEADAQDAAKIFVGTDWRAAGYHVDPVIIVRIRKRGRPPTEPEHAHV